MRRRRLRLLLVSAIVLTLPCCRFGGSKPNVILVLIDTLRADRLGAYGNGRGLTPFLDELATRGTIFTHVYAASSWTVPSVASLFTSRYPSQHHVTTFDAKLSDDEVTLAEALAAGGYDTSGIQANFRLTKDLGFAQGFANWSVLFGSGVKVRGDRVHATTMSWVAQRRAAKSHGPTFLYLQYMEPHSPYEPPAPFRERFERVIDGVDPANANAMMRGFNFRAFTPDQVSVLESLYDGEVAFVDDELRTLFGALEQQGLLKDALVIVTADHGEEFKEHGRMSHGNDLYNETVRVPLIMVGPGVPQGKVIDDNVSLIDLAPTVVDLVGLPPQKSFEGRSLVSLMKRESFTEWLIALKHLPPDVITELPKTGSPMDIRGHSRAIVKGRNKLLIGLQGPDKKEVPELYDLTEDPGETTPLRTNGMTANLQAALQRHSDELAQRAGTNHETAVVDDATKEKLRALGYHY